MNKRTPLALVLIGGVAFVMMLIFYYSALEQGVGLEPLIDLRSTIQENYNVTDVTVNWKKASREELKNRPIKGPGTTWVVIEFVPTDPAVLENGKKTEKLLDDILRHSINQYPGKRKKIVGFRIRCFEKEEHLKTLLIEKERYLRRLPDSEDRRGS